jgi:hypothetical protein
VKPLSLDALAAVNIPKRGTNCYLDVVANKGTTFSVVEHPL